MKSYRILQYPRESSKIVQVPLGLIWKMGWKIFAIVQDPTGILWNLNQFWAQLFEGQLALNLELKLTLISFSCVLKHFLG